MTCRLRFAAWVIGGLGLLMTLSSVAAASKPPAAAKGLQVSYQLGPVFPLGRATGEDNDTLSARYNWMMEPAFVGIGARFAKYWYLGGYFGFALGAKGTDHRVKTACRDNDYDLNNDIACTVVSVRTGLEARFSFRPDTYANPWLSYGFGPVLTRQSINDRVIDRREATRVTGWEYARLSSGVMFRPGKVFGVGPFASATLGRFLRTRTTINGEEVNEGKIENRALHAWIGVGLRMEFFP